MTAHLVSRARVPGAKGRIAQSPRLQRSVMRTHALSQPKLPAAPEFLKWASEVKISSPKLKLQDFDGMRGAAATQPIKDQEVIVSIPRKVALQVSPVTKSPRDDVDAAFWKKAPWFLKLGLMVLLERDRGAESHVQRYIDELPAEDTPIHWTEADQERVQYPHMRRLVQQQRAQWEKLLGQLQESSPECSVSKQDLWWALTAVRSRCFSGPYIGSTLTDRLRLAALVAALVGANVVFQLAPMEQTLNAAIAVLLFNIMYEVLLSRDVLQYAMCPMIDFMNHQTAMSSEVTYDYFRDTFSVAAGRDFQPGEQVYISYGIQTTDSLFQYYGFVEADNVNDTYTFSDLASVLPSSAQARLKAPAAEHPEVLTALTSEVVVSSKARLQPDVMQAGRYLVAKDGRAFADCKGKGSASEEQALWKLLASAGKQELDSMPTTAEQDEAELASRAFPLEGRQRLAVSYNLEKKRYLMKCIARWEERAEKAGKAESDAEA